MKSRVVLSRYCVIMTLLVAGLLIFGLVASYDARSRFFVFLAIVCVTLFLSLRYAPLWINAADDAIEVRSPMRKVRFAYSDIKSVELFQPTMAAMKVCGSGGFCGHWGLYREGDIGLYMAYYGKASECFLLRMKTGDKVVLGCADALAMTDYINSRIY